MNCKQGDLAIVVGSLAGNNGQIVRCVRLIGFFPLPAPDGKILHEWLWEIDKPLVGIFGQYGNDIQDSALHPIRPPEQPDGVRESSDMEVTA